MAAQQLTVRTRYQGLPGMQQAYGGEAYFDEEDLAGETARPGHFRELFAPVLRARTSFVCIFWACLVAPYFAIFTFAPLVFAALHISAGSDSPPQPAESAPRSAPFCCPSGSPASVSAPVSSSVAPPASSARWSHISGHRRQPACH